MASVLTTVKQTLYTAYMKQADKVKPTLTESHFIEEGVLTPDEFVAAGDMLVYKCKMWEWASGDPSRAVPYLPPNKQYLVTKNVRCAQRCAALEKTCAEPGAATGTRMIKLDRSDDIDDDEWVAPSFDTTTAAPEALATIPAAAAPAPAPAVAPAAPAPAPAPAAPAATSTQTVCAAAANDGDDDDDDDDDMDAVEFDDEDLMDDDPAVAPPQLLPQMEQAAAAAAAAGGNAATGTAGTEGEVAMGDSDDVLRTRTYDLFITYDHFYRTPRVWLSGYDEQMRPLQPEQVFEDISADHAHKTVTFDEFPHLVGVQMAYIHPCKHAAVMKKIIARQMEAGGSAANITVEQYLILFIKFISAVIPTIEYDFTMEIEG